MKINNKSTVGQSLANIEANKKATDVKLQEQSKSPSSGVSKAETLSAAKVELSTKAKQIKQAKDIASESSVDEAKVARLQKMIDSGKYSVNASALADKLVDEHLLMSDS